MTNKHATAGLTRECNANDLFLITGGLQCGNCMAVFRSDTEHERCGVPALSGPCEMPYTSRHGCINHGKHKEGSKAQ